MTKILKVCTMSFMIMPLLFVCECVQLGEELPVNERQIVYGSNGSLVLKEILPSDAGTYSCVVTAQDAQVANSRKHHSSETAMMLRASQDLSVSVMGKTTILF